MNAFSRSFLLFKQSLSVLKAEREILLFPIITAVVSVAVAISIFLPVHFIFNGIEAKAPYLYFFLFLYYLVDYFIITFFSAGLVTCTYMKLNGLNPTFRDGIENAKKHIGKIFMWALVSATVGMVLRLLAERSGLIGKIILAIIGMAWSLLTYFIVPVLIYDDLGIGESIKESGSLFKKTWGENAVGNASMSLFFMLCLLLGFIPLVGIIFVQSVPFIITMVVIMIVYWVFLGILSSSLSGIFSTALYIYAKTGKISPGFDSDFIQNAFKSKNEKTKIVKSSINTTTSI